MALEESATNSQPFGLRGNGNDIGDGVFAATRTSTRNGLFGQNQARTRHTPNAPVGNGVCGLSSVPDASGVFGLNDGGGIGVAGHSNSGDGVVGTTDTSSKNGIFGHNRSTSSVPAGGGPVGNGVFGLSSVPNASGIFGVNDTPNGIGVFGRGGRLAGRFDGNVMVTGDVTLTGADCAEDFDVSGTEEIDPGTVVVIDEEGAVRRSQQAYDKRVAGVVAGAGGLKPGIILDKEESNGGRLPVSLMGKVYCKVDARHFPIGVGDLLTTSSTPGCAMKTADPYKAFGAVLGKALRPLKEGQGLIPILVALQ